MNNFDPIGEKSPWWVAAFFWTAGIAIDLSFSDWMLSC